MSDNLSTESAATSISPLDTVSDPTATDPLSQVTRGERKALLASCAIGLAISVGNLVPQRIEALGIIVSSSQKDNLLQILAGIIAFLLVGFVIYAWADLRRRDAIYALAQARVRPAMASAVREGQFSQEQWKDKSPEEMTHFLQGAQFQRLAALSDHATLAKRVSRVGAIRIVFDIYLPALLGIGTILTILATTQASPIARFLEAILAIGTPTCAAIVLANRRHDITKWFRTKIRRRRDKYLNKVLARMTALPEDSPLRDELQAKVRQLIERNLEDAKKGVF